MSGVCQSILGVEYGLTSVQCPRETVLPSLVEGAKVARRSSDWRLGLLGSQSISAAAPKKNSCYTERLSVLVFG